MMKDGEPQGEMECSEQMKQKLNMQMNNVTLYAEM